AARTGMRGWRKKEIARSATAGATEIAPEVGGHLRMLRAGLPRPSRLRVTTGMTGRDSCGRRRRLRVAIMTQHRTVRHRITALQPKVAAAARADVWASHARMVHAIRLRAVRFAHDVG